MSPKSKRGVMTKTLEQIQKENRKFILEAIGEYSDEFYSKPLTLSRVLLALKDKEVGFYNGCLGEVWVVGGLGGRFKENYLIYICDWDLKKETLEEQSEETQRGLNKFFNDYK